MAELGTKRADLGSEWAGLIERVAQGDQHAFAKLYDCTSSYVFGLIVRIVGDHSAAEEVTLDVYTQAWRNAGQYSSQRGTPSAWLLNMARSRAIDRLRSKAQRRREREQSLETSFELIDPAPSPEDAAAATGRRRVIREALESIQPQQRQAIEMAYCSGMTHTEIAERLGEPLGTVKTRIRLGMLRLREALGSQGRTI